MKHLIDKDALVEEIERLKTIYNDEENIHHIAKYNILVDILSFINTLEAKEVDLEKEIDKWWCSQFTDYSMVRVPNHKFVPKPEYIDSNFKQSEVGKTKIGYELCIDWKIDSNDIEWSPDTIRNFAKYFYELGLKAQKGE